MGATTDPFKNKSICAHCRWASEALEVCLSDGNAEHRLDFVLGKVVEMRALCHVVNYKGNCLYFEWKVED